MRARLRLASLWVSQVARVLGDGCLRLVAMLEVAGRSAEGRLSAWHVATAAFIAPFIALAPLNGCLSNALPRRWVLAGSAAFTLLAVGAFALAGGPWVACLAVVAVGAAVNSAARYALLPAAARDGRLPLPRVSGWVEMGAAAAVVASVAVGLSLPHAGWPADGSRLAGRAVLVILGLNLLSCLTALPCHFPSDKRRPERPGQAVAGFFTDLRRVARDPHAAGALLALAGFQALVTAGAGPLVADALTSGNALEDLITALVLVGAGAALGSLTAAVQGHPRRSLGLVTVGAWGLLLALGWAMATVAPGRPPPLVPCLLLGFAGGLVNAPLRAAYLAAVPADARGNGTAVMNTAIYVLTAGLAGLLVALVQAGLLTTPLDQLAVLAVIACGGAALALWLLLRDTLELMLEVVLAPVYRVRAHGPGAGRLPERGALLVVANHSSYADPLWLGKVVPRLLTPLMTSRFYDKPLLRWLMVHVVGAIRVQQSGFRREAPELGEAVAALRRGRCVVLFPEAALRRAEGQLLRPFGQGVWHILRELPDTPVAVCWIEGGWGSFASYKGGPPLKNKRPDWWRRIDVAVAEPAPLDPEVLADQRRTRRHLMRACLGCRRYLGLDVPEVEDEPAPQASP